MNCAGHAEGVVMRIETVNAKGEREEVTATQGYIFFWGGPIGCGEVRRPAIIGDERDALREAIALSPFNPENR